MASERLTAYFSGSVQGVGFRFTALRISESYQVTGYIRNLPDGRVELVAEGEKKELDEFFRAIKKRMSSYIRDVDERHAPAKEDFKTFVIRH